MANTSVAAHDFSKVPLATLGFWIIKILATTLGETGGDALSMSLDLDYAISSLIFLGFFIVMLTAQIRSRQFHSLTYWAVVIATTTVGTTTSDYMDRTLGLGYVKSSIALLCIVVTILVIWRWSTGVIAFDRITTRRNETFYWLTILVSNTLGTALGDFVATSAGLGFEGGALVFAALIALVASAHYLTSISTGVLFWSAYILTRPLGATLGDVLTKPLSQGGLDLSRITSSLVILAIMAVGVFVIWRMSASQQAPQES